ncbi:hypothetical protein FD755_008038 [Muntiacus reevesi]|uniref:ZZ-type domain-containing protein n=1 Tax=Muntiacus reevesi TaxID=9886 RepID=A0A5J5MJ85_MUNRE|nr:hypothetical protein FD755_008038 [Muntiacus reevesi]
MSLSLLLHFSHIGDRRRCDTNVSDEPLRINTCEGRGKLTVFSVKAMLATMCGGKMLDKLRYVFSQMSDSNGLMIFSKFDQFLKEVLKLPTAVFEGPSFGYTEHSVRTCFPQQKKIMLNMFLDTMMADPPPQCLVWLPLMHRLAHVENVFHPVECSYCRCESMMGFRYRCQQCHNYQLCQNCFWRGHASGPHSNQHQMKEHSSWHLSFFFFPSSSLFPEFKKMPYFYFLAKGFIDFKIVPFSSSSGIPFGDAIQPSHSLSPLLLMLQSFPGLESPTPEFKSINSSALNFLYKLGQRKEKQTVSREQEIRVERDFEHQRPSKYSHSLQPHALQHTGLPCPSPTPEACSNSCLSSHLPPNLNHLNMAIKILLNMMRSYLNKVFLFKK